MAKRYELYKCELCGNIVEVMRGAGGKLACCGQNMTLINENSVDASQEKHVPVIEKTGNGFKIKVGSVAHPMEEKHYIEWVELVADGASYVKFLNPGDAPEATFCISANSITAKAYCNLHSLWIAK